MTVQKTKRNRDGETKRRRKKKRGGVKSRKKIKRMTMGFIHATGRAYSP
jgi:hypothetical protein